MEDNIFHRLYAFKQAQMELEENYPLHGSKNHHGDIYPVGMTDEDKIAYDKRYGELVGMVTHYKKGIDAQPLEKKARGKQLPVLTSLADFLAPQKIQAIPNKTVKRQGRKWLCEHLDKRTTNHVEQLLDIIEKYNKSTKDEELRYDVDVIMLKEDNRKTRIKNNIIFQARWKENGKAIGLFYGFIDGQWTIFC